MAQKFLHHPRKRYHIIIGFLFLPKHTIVSDDLLFAVIYGQAANRRSLRRKRAHTFHRQKAAVFTVYQFNAEFVFKRPYLLRYGGLRNIALFGGFCKTVAFNNGNQIFHLPQQQIFHPHEI